MRSTTAPPLISIRNAQRLVPLALPGLRAFAVLACASVWKHRRAKSTITHLRSVFVTIVGDVKMAKLHQQFSGIRGSTDVLTFHHGEIIVSAGMASRRADEFGSTIREEIELYLLHGLLHLAGYDDRTGKMRSTMGRLQGKILLELRGQMRQ